MNFQDVVNQNLPGMLNETLFMSQLKSNLRRLGFTANNTITCVSTCRDELCRQFHHTMDEQWGEAFNFSSLAGFLSLGETGFSAAIKHAPKERDKQRFLFVVMPHIAIDLDGRCGKIIRNGHRKPTSACGALVTAHSFLKSNIQAQFNPRDPEQSLLQMRLQQALNGKPIPGILPLTQLTHQLIKQDLENFIDTFLDQGMVDYTVVSGIQVHGPSNSGFVWPGGCYAMVDGQRHAITLS